MNLSSPTIGPEAVVGGLSDRAHNLVLHEAPLCDTCGDYYHRHISILPRLATAAGFELDADIWVNSVLLAEAADYLRGFVPQQPGRPASVIHR